MPGTNAQPSYDAILRLLKRQHRVLKMILASGQGRGLASGHVVVREYQNLMGEENVPEQKD